jgi:uncharacterized protein with HEPN domain
LRQLAAADSELAARVTEYPRIIALRNVLIHGYATVDDRIVWGLLESRLPRLKAEVEELLSMPGATH